MSGTYPRPPSPNADDFDVGSTINTRADTSGISGQESCLFKQHSDDSNGSSEANWKATQSYRGMESKFSCQRSSPTRKRATYNERTTMPYYFDETLEAERPRRKCPTTPPTSTKTLNETLEAENRNKCEEPNYFLDKNREVGCLRRRNSPSRKKTHLKREAIPYYADKRRDANRKQRLRPTTPPTSTSRNLNETLASNESGEPSYSSDQSRESERRLQRRNTPNRKKRRAQSSLSEDEKPKYFLDESREADRLARQKNYTKRKKSPSPYFADKAREAERLRRKYGTPQIKEVRRKELHKERWRRRTISPNSKNRKPKAPTEKVPYYADEVREKDRLRRLYGGKTPPLPKSSRNDYRIETSRSRSSHRRSSCSHRSHSRSHSRSRSKSRHRSSVPKIVYVPIPVPDPSSYAPHPPYWARPFVPPINRAAALRNHFRSTNAAGFRLEAPPMRYMLPFNPNSSYPPPPHMAPFMGPRYRFP